jgi:hypothetical protein
MVVVFLYSPEVCALALCTYLKCVSKLNFASLMTVFHKFLNQDAVGNVHSEETMLFILGVSIKLYIFFNV